VTIPPFIRKRVYDRSGIYTPSTHIPLLLPVQADDRVINTKDARQSKDSEEQRQLSPLRHPQLIHVLSHRPRSQVEPQSLSRGSRTCEALG
jgi:hypothetical protein